MFLFAEQRVSGPMGSNFCPRKNLGFTGRSRLGLRPVSKELCNEYATQFGLLPNYDRCGAAWAVYS